MCELRGTKGPWQSAALELKASESRDLVKVYVVTSS